MSFTKGQESVWHEHCWSLENRGAMPSKITIVKLPARVKAKQNKEKIQTCKELDNLPHTHFLKEVAQDCTPGKEAYSRKKEDRLTRQ